jgi:hypothetical protein
MNRLVRADDTDVGTVQALDAAGGLFGSQLHWLYLDASGNAAIVTPQLAQPDRPASFDYRASLGCTPLQSADVIAHGAFQPMRNHLNGLTEVESPSIRDIKDKCPMAVECFFDAEYIDIIQRSRIRGDD